MLTIGQLSDATGIPTSTLRFWERKGLLEADARQGGQRRYHEDALTKVALLRLCQDAGWTLTEIGAIVRERLALSPSWREIVRDKMDSLEREVAHLAHAHQMLEHALSCPYPDITQCPKFREALDHRRGIRDAEGINELVVTMPPAAHDHPELDSESPACGHSLGDLPLGHEAQERDRAAQHHEQTAQQ